MSPNAFFSRTRRSSGQQKNDTKTLFSTLHPLSPVIFATATVVAFVLHRNSRFNFHCYTQPVYINITPTQKSACKWRCDLSRLLARKITEGIHLCKPASGEFVNSFDFCPALLKSLGCFYFRCVLSSQWKAANFTLPTLKTFLEACSQNVSDNKQ